MSDHQLEQLSAVHDTSVFECGAPEIDDWLRRRALAGQASGNASVFVVAPSRRVLGFYSLSAGAVARGEPPGPVRRNAPEPVPVLLLGRLGVTRAAHGRGVARLLVHDALLRAARVSIDVGFRALLIHARDDHALAFYRRVAPQIRPSPTDPLHLYYPTADLVRAVQRAAQG